MTPTELRKWCGYGLGAVGLVSVGWWLGPALFAGGLLATEAAALLGALTAAGGVGAGTGRTAAEIIEVIRAKRVLILGPPRAGKNSLYDRIKDSGNQRPQPTAPTTRTRLGMLGRTRVRKANTSQETKGAILRDIYEVTGESHLTWIDVINEVNPHGILYIVDSPVKAWRRKNDRTDLRVVDAGSPDPDNVLKRNVKVLRL